jgi:hypothetical protein
MTLASCADASALAEAIAQRCAGAHPSQDGWRARCPNHNGQSATSLSITPADDRVLLKCFGTCEPGEVVKALGLTMADLFVWRAPQSNSQRRIVRFYDYVDANGLLAHQAVRYDPKDFRQRRPDPANPGQWIWNLQGIEPVLYRLPEVLAAITRGEVIYVTEGERDADNLQALGLTATCNCLGAGKWRASYTECLRGAQVVLLPDHDEPGRKHMRQVASSLHGQANAIRLVELPGLPAKGDVSDWLATGGTRTQLEGLVAATPTWAPETAPTPARDGVWASAVTARDFLLQAEDDVPAHAKDLVVPGCITVVSAPRASGKSLVALYLGVALATGGVFRGERLTQRRVLLVDRDNPPSLVRKRLRWLGAHNVTALKVLTRELAPPLTSKQDWAQFPVTDYDVVLVDSLGAATEGISEKEGRQTQEFLATLKDLARRGPAILALDNTNKAATSYRGRGEKADAVDILYECRNVTGWTPAYGVDWWEDLPDFGEHTWQQRASRRKGQAVLRIAFIPSKFRLGIEPEPFVLEIDTRQDPWTLSDVTEALATAGEQAAQEQSRQAGQQVAHAAAMLVQALQKQPDQPILKTEAQTILEGYGLTRKTARTLLISGGNRDVFPAGEWELRPIPGHPSGTAIGVYLAGTHNDGKRSDTPISTSKIGTNEALSFAVGLPLDGKRSDRVSSRETVPLSDAGLLPQPGHSPAKGGAPFAQEICGSPEMAQPFAGHTPSNTHSDDTCPCVHEYVGTDAAQVVCLDRGQDLGEETDEGVI